MTHSEMLKFANVINDGMDKEATALLSKGIRAVGSGLGRAAFNTVDAGKWIGGMLGQGAKSTAKFLTKERHLPNSGFVSSAKGGWNAAKGEMGAAPLPQGALRPVKYQGHPNQFDPRRNPIQYAPSTSPAPANYGYAGQSGQIHMPNVADNFTQYAPGGVHVNEVPGALPKTAPSNTGTGASPSAGAAYDPNDVSHLPPGMLRPSPGAGGYMDRAKQFWSARSMPQKFGLGYGGVTAATAVPNYINNQKANWQQEHPIQSFFARNFAGMPQYQSHSYLLPSFIQR